MPNNKKMLIIETFDHYSSKSFNTDDNTSICRSIIWALENTPEGKDLSAITPKPYIDLENGRVQINSGDYTIRYNKNKKWLLIKNHIVREYSEKIEISDLPKMFSLIWELILGKISNLGFINKGIEKESEKYINWITKPQNGIKGKGLSITEIVRIYLSEEEGIYYPDGSEFTEEPWNKLIRYTGFSSYCNNSKSDFNEQIIFMIDPITTGELSNLYRIICLVYNINYLGKSTIGSLSIKIAPENIKWSNSSFQIEPSSFQIAPKSKEDYLKILKEYLIKQCVVDNSIIEVDYMDDPISQIMIGILQNNLDLNKIYLMILGGIKRISNPYSILSKIKNVDRGIWESMIKLDSDNIEGLKIGSDLGDFGF